MRFRLRPQPGGPVPSGEPECFVDHPGDCLCDLCCPRPSDPLHHADPGSHADNGFDEFKARAAAVEAFLRKKYVVRRSERSDVVGAELSYLTAEVTDLAEEIARLIGSRKW